ncbi:hypothetical protein HAX54_037564 [Datura stramonium]|uniref:Uncharacterized protein n=1 Tax=Datura stramonium TaxID=4076 RepID=A0ABS8SHE0_DATST|nr:hypothetical protein [Datura stramonium]
MSYEHFLAPHRRSRSTAGCPSSPPLLKLFIEELDHRIVGHGPPPAASSPPLLKLFIEELDEQHLFCRTYVPNICRRDIQGQCFFKAVFRKRRKVLTVEMRMAKKLELIAL